MAKALAAANPSRVRDYVRRVVPVLFSSGKCNPKGNGKQVGGSRRRDGGSNADG